MTAHIAVFGETMVFFTSGNSCQFWGSRTGFFESRDEYQLRRVSAHVSDLNPL